MAKFTVTPLIIDTDPGIDDAAALIMGFFSRRVNILAIGTSVGNLGLNQTTKNACHLVELYDRKIPVVMGYDKPLSRPLKTSGGVHGPSGLGGYDAGVVSLKPVEQDYCDFMHNLIINYNEKITLLAIGPLTNFAKLFLKYPDVLPKIKELIFMGGALEDYSNKVPYFGFNCAVDPEAVKVVLDSGVKVILCPMEHGHNGFLSPREIDALARVNNTGKMLKLMFSCYHDFHVKVGAAMHDSAAMAYVLRPDLFKKQNANLNLINYNDSDRWYISPEIKKSGNNYVLSKMNIAGFKRIYINYVKKVSRRRAKFGVFE